MAAAVISSKKKSDDNVPLGWVRLVGWKKKKHSKKKKITTCWHQLI